MDLRRSARPRVVKKKSDIVYFDDQRIELTDQEKDLIYPNEKQKEKRYCFCKRTEEEAIGLTMIQCDGCHDWFHDECLGRRPEELQLLEVYYCPTCSSNKFSKNKKPSNAELELLLAALAELDEERPKNKKKEQKVQIPKISIFHFTDPNPKLLNVLGYIRNDSSSSNEEGKMIVPVTKTDLDRGVVWTPWGSYKIGMADGKLLTCSEPLKGAWKLDDKVESPLPVLGKVEISEKYSIVHGPDDLIVELPRKNRRFVMNDEDSRVLKMTNCSSFEKFKELTKTCFKNKLLKEMFYSN
jgi:hypothetical protein